MCFTFINEDVRIIKSNPRDENEFEYGFAFACGLLTINQWKK